ncbi:MAG: ACP S-malonyltransferase [Kiritimatiellia bacterium]|jgi:[acyl-carrier-protein] S-malonyltransferase|nr:ACP S-malonyltransferase [Kiritimatiellia bacterium]
MSWMLLFPGQGAQVVGMGGELAAELPECRALFEQASQVLGFDLLRLCTEGPLEELTRSGNTQPAIFVVSMAARLAWAQLAGSTVPVAGAAGLSSGEWAALHEAGVVSFDDTVRILQARGHFMQAACEATPGGMLTIIGLPLAQVREVAAASGLEIANLNSPVQTVLSGHADRIAAGEAAAKAAGAKRALRLTVAGAFHSSLMQPAADQLAAVLQDIDFQAPRIPVWSNVTGHTHTTPDAIRRRMVEQVVSSVRWTDCFSNMVAAGMDRAVECGPGAVLAGLGRRIEPAVKVLNIFDLAGAREVAKLVPEV